MKPTLDDFRAAGGHYAVIYDDYPWQYDQGGRGAAKNHYGVEGLDYLRRLTDDVGVIALPNAVKFSWVGPVERRLVRLDGRGRALRLRREHDRREGLLGQIVPEPAGEHLRATGQGVQATGVVPDRATEESEEAMKPLDRLLAIRKIFSSARKEHDVLIGVSELIDHHDDVLRGEPRERLAADREGLTHHFAIATGQAEPADWLDCYVSVGLYADQRVGEIFVKVGKSGEALAALDQWAIAVSFALQYGADARELLGKFVGQRFEPSGMTRGCEEIRACSSLVDYVARWVLLRFYPEPAAVEGTP